MKEMITLDSLSVLLQFGIIVQWYGRQLVTLEARVQSPLVPLIIMGSWRNW